jgi:hypothetical protein
MYADGDDPGPAIRLSSMSVVILFVPDPAMRARRTPPDPAVPFCRNDD